MAQITPLNKQVQVTVDPKPSYTDEQKWTSTDANDTFGKINEVVSESNDQDNRLNTIEQDYVKEEDFNIISEYDDLTIPRNSEIILDSRTGNIQCKEFTVSKWNAFSSTYLQVEFEYIGIPQFIIYGSDATHWNSFGIGQQTSPAVNYTNRLYRWSGFPNPTFQEVGGQSPLTSPNIGDTVKVQILDNEIKVFYNEVLKFVRDKQDLINLGMTNDNYGLGFSFFSFSQVNLPIFELGGDQVKNVMLTKNSDEGGECNCDDTINLLNISILGDSFSTDGGGGTGEAGNDTYFKRLESDGHTIFRNAIAGSCVAFNSGIQDFVIDSRWQSLNSVISPDVIFIYGGVNDFLQGIPLGTVTTPSDPTDTNNTTFYGALKYVYENVLNTFKGAKVYHITPMHNQYDQQGSFVPTIPEFNSNSSLFLNDYVKAIKEVAELYGVGIIDVYEDSFVSAYNIDDYSNDNIHVDGIAHRDIYDIIVRKLKFKELQIGYKTL